MAADDYDNDIRSKQPAFIGMKSPESLKSVCSMFKNAEHKSQPERYKSNLLNHVNYQQPDFEKTLKVDIQFRSYGGGIFYQAGSAVPQDDLRIRVFKIYFNKKKKDRQIKGLGKRDDPRAARIKIEEDTESEYSMGAGGGADADKGKEDYTLMNAHGMTAMQTLNDQDCFQRYLELIAQASLNGESNNKPVDFERDLRTLRANLERQKKIRQQGKIMTEEEVNRLEIDRMINNLREIEKKIIIKTGINVQGPNPATD